MAPRTGKVPFLGLPASTGQPGNYHICVLCITAAAVAINITIDGTVAVIESAEEFSLLKGQLNMLHCSDSFANMYHSLELCRSQIWVSMAL